MKKTYLGRIIALVSVFSLLLPAVTHAQSTINPGDLIKGPMSSVYYYGTDGRRYVFPNEKTYFTWYNSFSGVKTVSANQLADIAIGGNVTYRPGVRLVKITTDPRTYAVERGGLLRHVTTEALASTLYGTNWNRQVDDVSDAFFVNYRIGTPITAAGDFNPGLITSQTTTIGQDKGLAGGSQSTTASVNIINTVIGFSPTSIVVTPGTQVTWTNNDSLMHTVTSETPGLFDSGILQPGQTYTRVFSTTGTFPYRDTLRPELRGTVTVQ